MSLYELISQRKSVRQYKQEKLPESLLAEIDDVVRDIEPLYPDKAIIHRYATEIKGRFTVPAPHYMVISGQGRDGELENAGFIYQQLSLWLDARGIGSVWLGASKETGARDTSKDIVILAFGYPEEDLHRSKDAFKRKPAEQMTNAPEDPLIQAALLAPSGMNSQPWYFEKMDGQVVVYRQSIGPMSLLYKLSDLDIGIALSHYALAAHAFGSTFSFTRTVKTQAGDKGTSFGVIV